MDETSSQIPSITEKKSGNKSIDEFIQETQKDLYKTDKSLRWIDFEKFKDIKQIGEGGFAKVYSATWLDGGKKSIYTDPDGTQKIRTLPNTIVLKSIKGSNEISAEFINEMEIYYRLTLKNGSLPFYGITKDPNSSEFMTVTGLAVDGSLQSILAKRFTQLNWKKKIHILLYIIADLNKLHEQGICHKDFHCGNILRGKDYYYLTDFGLSGPSNKSSKEIYGVLAYVAPEVLKGKPYCGPADIYSFGIIMSELSTGFPPYSNKNMSETGLALSICDGLRPDFGKGTPEVYKSLAYKCMDANPEKRPTASELEKNISYWYHCLTEEINDDDTKKIKVGFDIADKEIPNVQSLFKKNSKNSNFKYVSKQLSFNNVAESTSINIDSSLIDLKLTDDIDEDSENGEG